MPIYKFRCRQWRLSSWVSCRESQHSANVAAADNCDPEGHEGVRKVPCFCPRNRARGNATGGQRSHSPSQMILRLA